MDVAILYEDWGTGVRAKQACDRVAQQVGPELALCLELWRFDLLEQEFLHTEALREALASDLLIVSAHGHRALPRTLERWLHQWLVQRLAEPTGLVISLDAAAKGSAAANRLLDTWAQLAKSARVDLFVHFGSPSQGRAARVFWGVPTERRLPGRAGGEPRPER